MRRKILVICNQKEIPAQMDEMLAPRGFDVVAVSGESEALAVLSEQKTDLIFLGLEGREPAGLDILKKIRERDSEARVIVFTPCPNLQTVMDSMDMGAREYVGSPLDRDMLGGILDDELGVKLCP